MWLFTRHGFYSAVQGLKDGPGGRKVPDPDVIVVRARVRQHLVSLGKLTGAFKSKDITSSNHTDYRYRVVLPAATWQWVAEALAGDVDYDNFKSAAGRKGDPEYVHALHKIWSIMYNLQLEATEGRNRDRLPPY